LDVVTIALLLPLTPTAQQSEIVGHETALRYPAFFGKFCTDHVVPPSVVAITIDSVL
jgi:hypothetical protein